MYKVYISTVTSGVLAVRSDDIPITSADDFVVVDSDDFNFIHNKASLDGAVWSFYFEDVTVSG